MFKCKLLYVLVVCFLPLFSFAQTANDYRSVGTGSWTTLATWERWNGSAWLTPTVGQGTPTSGVNTITISSGHTVNVSSGSSITIDQTTVIGTLQIDNNGTVIINGGTGIDLTLAGGSLNVTGTLSLGNNATTLGTTSLNTAFLSGSRFRNLWQGGEGAAPLATWDINSTVELAGYTSSRDLSLLGNWGQSFGNFEVNVISLPSGANRVVNANGLLSTINGNLIITSTGGGNFRINDIQTSTLAIAGSFLVSGTSSVQMNQSGIFTLTVAGAFSTTGSSSVVTTRSGTTTMTVGSFLKSSSGTFNMAEQNPSSTSLNVTGNFTFTGGTITKGNSGGAVASINFIGTSTQTYSRTSGNFTQIISFTIASNAIVDTGTSSFNGTGPFTLSGTLRTGSSTGLNGTLANSGTKTFNSNSTIEYNGAVAQVMGGLYPVAPASGINVIINNAAGVTTSSLIGLPASTITSITGNLFLQSGTLTVGAGHTLELNGSLSQTAGTININAIGSLTINGAGALGVDPFPFAGDQTFSGFTLNRGGNTVTFANQVTLNGVAALSNGTLDISNTQLTLNNNVAITSGLLYSNAGTTLSFDVSGTVDPINFAPGGNIIGTLNLSKAGATVSFGSDFTITSSLNITNGILAAGASTITMTGSSWSVDGGAGGTFDPGTGLVIFDGATSVPFGTDFNNLQLLTTRSLDFPSGAVNVSGNIDFAIASVFTPNSGTVVLIGGSDQSINAEGNEFYSIQVNKAGGAFNIISPLSLQSVMDVISATTINSNGNLTILSRGNTTNQDGSIGPLPPGASVVGNVTVQRFMQNTGTVNRYISAPISGMSVTQLDFTIKSGSLRYYDESVLGAIGLGYKSLSITTGSFQTGRGYLAYMYDGIDLTWTSVGTVHQGSFSLPVTFTSSSAGVNADGWNLVGNPYPSAVAWDGGAGWTISPNIDPIISVPDLSIATGYPTYYRWYNYTNGDGDLTGGEIAMGQAFWVHAISAGPSLMIHEEAKTSVGASAFYRKSVNRSEQLAISINNGKVQDKSFLLVNQDATEEYDRQLEATKLKNEFMNVFIVDKSQRDLAMYAIKSIDEDRKIQLGVEVSEAGEYEITFADLDRFSLANKMYLIDRFESTATAVSSTEGYRFTMNNIEKPELDRFYLSMNPTVPERKVADWVYTFPNPVKDELMISLPAGESAEVTLMDATGHTLWADQVKEKGKVDFRNYPSGLFLLKVSGSHGVMLKKILK